VSSNSDVTVAVYESRTYSGRREDDGTTTVTVDGVPLDPRVHFRHAPTTTFDWGYPGAGGPSQLALAILVDHFADEEQARRYYSHFVRRVVRHLPSWAWTLTTPQIDAALPGSR
jgi:hypothetical protein